MKRKIDSDMSDNGVYISHRKYRDSYTSPDSDSESCDISSGSGKQLSKEKHYKRRRSNIKLFSSKKHSRSHKFQKRKKTKDSMFKELNSNIIY